MPPFANEVDINDKRKTNAALGHTKVSTKHLHIAIRLYIMYANIYLNHLQHKYIIQILFGFERKYQKISFNAINDS